MTIETLIKAAELDGRLIRFVPRTRNPPQRRAFCSFRMIDEIRNPNSALNVLQGAGHVTAAITRWVAGDVIYKGFVKRLKPPPPDVWEIRVTWPSPQWRIFGCFAAQDTLVLSHYRSRGALGQFGSREWSAAMSECAAHWAGLFGSAPCYRNGDRSIGYVTGKCDDFKI